MIYIKDFLCAFVAVVAFAVLMLAPKKSIYVSAPVSALGYVLYDLIFLNSGQMYIGYFVATLTVALCGEIAARKMKMPSIVFIFPGIIPLVPGCGLYYTMLALIKNDFAGFQEQAVQTLLIALTIAFGVAITNIFVRRFFTLQKA